MSRAAPDGASIGAAEDRTMGRKANAGAMHRAAPEAATNRSAQDTAMNHAGRTAP